MYKQDLALDKIQGLVTVKQNQPTNQPIFSLFVLDNKHTHVVRLNHHLNKCFSIRFRIFFDNSRKSFD